MTAEAGEKTGIESAASEGSAAPAGTGGTETGTATGMARDGSAPGTAVTGENWAQLGTWAG